MKKTLKPRKLIVGITVAILVASAVLAGVITILLTGSQGKQETYVPDYDSDLIEIIDKIGENGMPSVFNIAWITDTQLNSRDNTWHNLTDYLVTVQDAYNIQLVIHTGDIVENRLNTTQWEIANDSMGKLLDNGVPYAWCTGNHDLFWHGLDSDEYIGSEYKAFDTAQQSHWYSTYNQRNTAVNFTYGGYDFLVICLEYGASPNALDWFINVLDDNTDKNILVATHHFVNATGGYSDGNLDESWCLDLINILDNHPNVFATINGHNANVQRLLINGRMQMLADYMNTDFVVVTYLTFDIDVGIVYVRTYQQTNNIRYTDDAYYFSFNIDLV